jgi:putative ABC transport system permease protein
MLGLTLGIGSTTTVFSIVDGILLKPLPFEDPEQLYRIDVSLPDEWTEVSVSEYEAWKSDNTTFTDIVTTSWGVLRRLGSPQARSFEGRAVPASLFRMLGADAVIGRTFLQEEDRPGGNPAVVLDYGTWQQDFGGDPSVIGQSLLLGDGYFPDRNYTILGVMPSAFAYPVTSAELWIPLGLERRLFSPLLSPLIRGLGPVTQKLPLSERSP